MPLRATRRCRGLALLIGEGAERPGVVHRRLPTSTARAAVASVALGIAVCACSSVNSNLPTSLQIFPAAGNHATARLVPRNGSAISGRFSFVQRGQQVAISGSVFDLTPGLHSIHIHETPNCSSPNAASAGAVWNVSGAAAPGRARTGDLPELRANSEGLALISVELRGLSVGSGTLDDVIGHAVVVQDGYVRDPRAEFGVPNGWIACGVIERE